MQGQQRFRVPSAIVASNFVQGEESNVQRGFGGSSPRRRRDARLAQLVSRVQRLCRVLSRQQLPRLLRLLWLLRLFRKRTPQLAWMLRVIWKTAPVWLRPCPRVARHAG